jgi:hypothetical protein
MLVHDHAPVYRDNANSHGTTDGNSMLDDDLATLLPYDLTLPHCYLLVTWHVVHLAFITVGSYYKHRSRMMGTAPRVLVS